MTDREWSGHDGSTRTRLLLVAGVAVAAVGGALTLRPSLVSGGWLPSVLAVAVWGVALAAAAAVALGRLASDADDDGGLPAASERVACPVPGDDVGQRVAAVGASERDAAERDAIRERVRRVAVATLVSRQDCSPAVARQRVADGTWTDDPEARRLFDPDTRHEGVERAFDGRFASAVDAVVALGSEDDPPATDQTDEGGEHA